MSERNETSQTRIYLVRHGETEWNRTHRFQGRNNQPLNQKGKEQAHALAVALKDVPLTAIYSSTLVRAMETAGFIKTFHPSLPIIEEKGLVEMELGDFDGMEAKTWAAQYPDFLKRWQEAPASVRMPGGENLQEVQYRALDAIERITLKSPPGTTLLLSSHNFVNLTILCHALEIPLDEFREVRQGTAALNVLHKQGERLSVEVINDRSHLQK